MYLSVHPINQSICLSLHLSTCLSTCLCMSVCLFVCSASLSIKPFLSIARSCINPRKGANPVPGPTIITGLMGRNGSRREERRMYIGILGVYPSKNRIHKIK